MPNYLNQVENKPYVYAFAYAYTYTHVLCLKTLENSKQAKEKKSEIFINGAKLKYVYTYPRPYSHSNKLVAQSTLQNANFKDKHILSNAFTVVTCNVKHRIEQAIVHIPFGLRRSAFEKAKENAAIDCQSVFIKLTNTQSN